MSKALDEFWELQELLRRRRMDLVGGETMADGQRISFVRESDLVALLREVELLRAVYDAAQLFDSYLGDPEIALDNETIFTPLIYNLEVVLGEAEVRLAP